MEVMQTPYVVQVDQEIVQEPQSFHNILNFQPPPRRSPVVLPFDLSSPNCV
jgi:hypothetical protein